MTDSNQGEGKKDGDEIFYLPHDPVRYDKETFRLSWVLPYFYTNASDKPQMIFAARVSEPVLFRVYKKDEEMVPESSTYIQLAYERRGQPNCAGVSQYVLTEGSKRDLEKHWKG